MSASPQKSANGVNQLKAPPEYCRSVTFTPRMKEPSTTPWAKVAAIEPKVKARSHQCRFSMLLNRNSNDTPRKISASSMTNSGR